jgi:hypothetical protein
MAERYDDAAVARYRRALADLREQQQVAEGVYAKVSALVKALEREGPASPHLGCAEGFVKVLRIAN